jgi:type IV secretory pathway VirD2 relaxase
LKRAGANSVAVHLRYIERDGVTREGRRGEAYGPTADSADLEKFKARSQGDRHQFRMIISVEDAAQLDELRPFTRELMKRVSTDLQTNLDWIAVDHWDTDNPHTHVVLRGRCGDGQDLVISPDYMAHGMRHCAMDLATEWLGPRTQLEIQQSLQEEVMLERFTSLDRTLLREARSNVVDTAELPGNARGLQLKGRLTHLQKMGLARRIRDRHWELSANMEATLRDIGERRDIVKAMHKALRERQRELSPAVDVGASIEGAVIGKGLHDEINDKGYLVIDGVDGRAHYVRLRAGQDLSDYPIGGIVQVRPAQTQGDGGRERGPSVRLQSHQSLENQVTATGVTWLDRQLLKSETKLSFDGFGATVRRALEGRASQLLNRGLGEQRAGKVAVSPQLLAQLEAVDLETAGVALESTVGKRYSPAQDSAMRAGTFRESIFLDSGRFAVIESERTFTLVPWRSDFDRSPGRDVLGAIGDRQLGARRGLSR